MISGAFELDMPDAAYAVQFDVTAHCSNGAKLVVGAKTLQVTLVSNKPVAKFLVPALLQ